MALAALYNLLCFCRHEQPEIEQPYDETSHLIPPTIEPPVIRSDEGFIYQQRMQERLNTIVRTKGGKMVNVASQIPFNLHNQVIPVEKSPHSTSRSVSSSGGLSAEQQYHPSQTYYDVYSNRDSARRRKRNPYIPHDNGHTQMHSSRSRSPSTNPEAGPSHGTRAVSPIRVQPKPTPILNVRLVGYTDVRTSRGRTKERSPLPTGLPASGPGTIPDPQLTEMSAGTQGVTSEGDDDTPKHTSNVETASSSTIPARLSSVGPVTDPSLIILSTDIPCHTVVDP